MLRSRSRTPPLTGHFRVQKRRPLVPTRDGFSRERIRREREKSSRNSLGLFFWTTDPLPYLRGLPPSFPSRSARVTIPVPHRIPLLPPSIPRLSDLFAPLKKPLLSAGPAPRPHAGWRLTASTGGSSSVCHHRHPRSIGAGFGYVGAGTRGTFGGARGVTSSCAFIPAPPPIRAAAALRQPPRETARPRPQPSEQPRRPPAQDP